MRYFNTHLFSDSNVFINIKAFFMLQLLQFLETLLLLINSKGKTFNFLEQLHNVFNSNGMGNA